MTSNRLSDTEISAYVDGELDAEAAARVAYAAARDPATAAQIAQLAKLKSVVADAFPDFDADAIARSRPPARHPRVRFAVALAASLAGVAIAAGALWSVLAPGPARPTFVDMAIRAHIASGADLAGPTQPVSVSPSLIAAPDLSAAKLTLRVAQAFAHEAGNALHFGYTGTRGCRLSLFVQLQPNAKLPDKVEAKGLRTAAWSQNGMSYLAVAENMDEPHFQTIVAALRRYSIERAPFGPAVQEQLAASREQSKPCLT